MSVTIDFESTSNLSRRALTPDLLEAARRENASVFVDFDHTLFACNSTELFIASCKPSLIVAIIEFIIRRCVPWRLSRLPNWFRIRDYVCCTLIILLCPWNVWEWKRVAPGLFAQSINTDLAVALRRLDLRKVSIISFGMAFVIRALLRGSEWSSAPLIATPMLTPWPYLKRGKLALAIRHVGEHAVAASTFVTDSLDDRDLLSRANVGVLIEPHGEGFSAIERLYLPLRYTARAKYTASYVLDQFVFVELFLLALSVSQGINELLNRVLPTALLFLSILCVYELGYFENDVIAAPKEHAPRLKDASRQFRCYPIFPNAWIWALVTGGLGTVLASRGTTAMAVGAFTLVPVWFAALVLLRLTFYFYNKPNMRLRLHLYPVLQILKFLPIFLLISPTPLGATLMTCQMAAMWAIYLTYRQGGRAKDVERELYRIILILLAIVLVWTTSAAEDIGWRFQLAMTGLWACARLAKAPLLKVGKGARAGRIKNRLSPSSASPEPVTPSRSQRPYRPSQGE